MAAKGNKLKTFHWEGIDQNGRRQSGDTKAQSQSSLRSSLRQQGIAAQKIRPKSSLEQMMQGSGGRRKKITPGDIAMFMRQLTTMMQAGVPLVQAFDIVGRGHDNPSMSELILNIKGDVEAGVGLADSLRKHPLYFDDLICNLVEAGEQGGVLDTLLDKIATYKEKTEAIKKKIKGALFYPVFVLLAAFGITAFLLIFVIPVFEDLFQGFGADLPAFTQMVIDISKFVRGTGGLMIAGIIAGIVVAFTAGKKRSRKFNYFLDRMMLKVPVFGDVVRKSAMARFSRTLATMFAAGVPLVDALDSVAGATGNRVYGNAVQQIRQQVASGQSLNQSTGDTQLFPHMVVQMIAIGEEAGSLDTMLLKVADFYEEEVDNTISAISSLMQPMIMIILGVLIGGLVIAMYLPIFKLASAI
jgi:type IV pilus assembly protein PilC